MQITVRRSSTIIEIEPWVPALEGMLSFRRVAFKFGQRGKSKPEFINEVLYNIDGNKGQVPSGMFARVYAELIKHHEVNIVDYRDMKALMPEPDFSRVEQLRPGQDKILLAVAGSDGGLLVGGCGVGKSFIIKQVCLMYPTLKIVVVSPRISVVKTIYEDLLKKMPSTAVAMAGGGRSIRGNPRVVVATTASMLKCDLAGCDLFLFDEVHGVGHNLVATNVARVTKARKFGFTATDHGRSDGCDFYMEAQFGPPLVNIEYDEAREAGLVTPIEVHVYPCPTASFIPDTDSMVAKQRWSFWRNSTRNQLIAKVAELTPVDEQCLIMCNTVEHAINLKKLLPKFTLVYGGTVDKKRALKLGVTKEAIDISKDELDKYRQEFSTGVLKHVICTRVWAEGLNMPYLALLIRADASSGEILSEQIPGRLSRLSEGKNVAVLVDFEDSFSPWALARARKRIAIYRRKKWKILSKTFSA